ncbi:TPA: hypothetical protein ACMDPN_001030 [Vibrio cholerae]|nr:hypothetical protein [Vibrio cholerae]EKF9814438.1 hypothetical protein [Vibrio cholerae]
MPIISSIPLRYTLGMSVTTSTIDSFAKDIKSITPQLDEDKNKKLISMMERYLCRGRNGIKKEKINNILSNINNGTPQKNVLDSTISEHAIPCCLSLLEEGVSSGRISKFEGTHRIVYIDDDTGFGLKILKNDSSWSKCFAADLRLNELYQDKRFYSGRYAAFSKYKIVHIEDDVFDGKFIKAIFFRKIPGCEPLSRWDQIPLSILLKLESMGFMPFDIKPDNFVKVKNDNDQYEYVPIDAKLIGKINTGSFRTIRVLELREQQGPYCYSGKYVDVAQ